MESRYKAITSAMSSQIQDLEEQEQKAASRWRHSREELDRQSEKYQLSHEEWRETAYDRRAENPQAGSFKHPRGQAASGNRV